MDSAALKLHNTSTDVLVSLARGGVGAIPFVGSLVAEVVGNIIPRQRVDRIVAFIGLLDQRLEHLEQEVLKTRFANPVVVDLLEDGFIQAVRATTTERLEHIANIVATGISAEELNQAESKRMLWLLGQLADAEIVILRSKLAMTREDMIQDEEFRAKHEVLLAPDATHMGSTEEEFEEAALKASYRQHLFDLGLVRRQYKRPSRGQLPEFDDETGMMKASGTSVTRLGRMLLEYLNLIPAWSRG